MDGLPARVAQLESLFRATLGGLEPHALSGFDALLQLVHATNTITTASANPQLHIPLPIEHVNRTPDNSVHTAAVALGQLSRQANATAGSSPHDTTDDGIDARLLLPDSDILDALLVHFFENFLTPWHCHIIDRPTFGDHYLAFKSGIHTGTPDFPALLATVCILALQFLPEETQFVNQPLFQPRVLD